MRQAFLVSWGGVGRDKSLLLHINYRPRPKQFSFLFFFFWKSFKCQLFTMSNICHSTWPGPNASPYYSLLLQYGACCLFNFPIDNWPLPPSHRQTDSDTPSVCNDETATDFGTVLCVALGCAQWASIIRLLLLFRNTCQNLYIRFGFYLLEVIKRSDWYLFFSSPLRPICSPFVAHRNVAHFGWCLLQEFSSGGMKSVMCQKAAAVAAAAVVLSYEKLASSELRGKLLHPLYCFWWKSKRARRTNHRVDVHRNRFVCFRGARHIGG